MQWFLKEQVEEVATMSALPTVVKRSADSPMLIEDYLARDHGGNEGADPPHRPRRAGPPSAKSTTAPSRQIRKSVCRKRIP